MFTTFKKLVKLNWDDLLLYLGVECGLFLLIEIVIGCLMDRSRPADVPVVMGTLMPCVAGFITLIAGVGHTGVSFDLALRFGQTRKRALGLTLGLMSFEAAFGMALAAVLAALERFVDGIPASNIFTLDWYWWLLIFAVAVMGGAVMGALIQRFGAKGLWVIWGCWMALIILPQTVPGYAVVQRHALMQSLPILGAVLLVAGFVWAVWSLLHAVVRG